MKSSKSIFDQANENLKEQSLSETATNIVNKAKKTVFKGLMGGLEFWKQTREFMIHTTCSKNEFNNI